MDNTFYGLQMFLYARKFLFKIAVKLEKVRQNVKFA